MIKNRKMGHIGLATNDVEKDAQWYIDVLGFEVAGKFKGDDGTNVYFLKNDDVMYEMFQANPLLPEAAAGKIDHYSFDSHHRRHRRNPPVLGKRRPLLQNCQPHRRTAGILPGTVGAAGFKTGFTQHLNT